MSNLGDRVRIVGTMFTGRVMTTWTEHYDDDGKFTPCMVVFDDGSYKWYDDDEIVSFRGLCPECKMYTKAPEGGFLPGHRCAKNYGRCDTELVYYMPENEVNDG